MKKKTILDRKGWTFEFQFSPVTCAENVLFFIHLPKRMQKWCLLRFTNFDYWVVEVIALADVRISLVFVILFFFKVIHAINDFPPKI